MDTNRSRNHGCLIPVLIVLTLGAILLYLDYLLVGTHIGPSFCTQSECEALRKFLTISAISAVWP